MFWLGFLCTSAIIFLTIAKGIAELRIFISTTLDNHAELVMSAAEVCRIKTQLNQ
jgi:hypothetical protein